VDRGLNGGLREWVAGMGRRELAVLAVVGVLVCGGAVLWYVRSLPRPVTVHTLRPEPAPSPSPVPVVVHVAGWIRRPGVYELAQGDRVIDAIEEAGGPRRGADLDALNLAAVLVDGQQVMIPRRPAVGGGPGMGSSASGGSAGTEALINVNTANADQLETLPGIGEVLAASIIEYRESNGPFASVDDLLEVSGIGEARLADIRDLVTV
jgi:competence protein ComEA